MKRLNSPKAIARRRATEARARAARLEEEARKLAAARAEHERRVALARAVAEAERLRRSQPPPQGPIPDALGLEAPDRVPDPLAARPPAEPRQRVASIHTEPFRIPPRRSTLPRGLMAAALLSLCAGPPLPDPDES